MVGRHTIPEADITIIQHLPPQDDDSAQDFSMSFAIPPQADASNLLDQNYDDFFSGPGFVTLSTPVLPRHLANTTQSVRKIIRTIQSPAVLPGLNLTRTPPTDSTAEFKPPEHRAGLEEAHISHHSLPSLSPRKKPPTGPPKTTSAVNTTSIVDPGPSRPSGTTSRSNPDSKIYDGLTSNAAPSMAATTKAFGKRPSIQSLPTSGPSHHSSNLQGTQIPRLPPKTAAQKANKVPAHPRGNTGVKSNRKMSKSRGGDGPDCETATCTQSHDRGDAAKRPNSTLSNNDFGRVNGRTGSNPICSNSRGNVTSHTPLTGNKHSDPDSLPSEGCETVTQSLVTRVSPLPASTQSGLNLEAGGADVSDSSPSPGPPRTARDHAEIDVPREAAEEEEAEEDDRLTVSRLSPSKTVRGCRDDFESSDWNEENSAPTPRVPLAISPMRPSKKRASSAGQESDNEPDGASPDELKKPLLITQSNREGEVRGGGDGKEVQGTRRVPKGKKSLALLQPSREKNGGPSSSLTLTRRLKAKAVRESPRVRKLRDKLMGRVSAGGGAGRRALIGGAPKVLRKGRNVLDVSGFPGNVGASATPSVAMLQGKGSDLGSLDETTGPAMPYSGDNQEEGGVISRFTGSVVGGPSFRSTLKRSTIPVEFRFELAARLGTSRGSSTREHPEPSASRSSGERGGHKVAGNPRKRPKLDELRGEENGEPGTVELASTSSRLTERKDDQTGSHAGAWKRNGRSRSKNSSATLTSRSKRKPLIIPEGFKFSTEQRAKDREKFDKAVRVKQGERERELEEERAAKAVEEEEEMKEMRKRTVPRANSVPEWYAAMPKRKGA